jgi:predicted peroxiredoxin
VCANTESFRSYGFRIGNAGGFVLNQRLFISPKPENTAERIPRILTHELSHLHLEQQMGSLQSARELPNWFKEGLAVHVSGGGGAENVTEEQARQSIASGRHFVPEAKGSLLFPTTAKAFGLEHHMFYRQSGMFVAHLQRVDEARFKAFLLAIEDGKSLASAFQTAYGKGVGIAWRDFILEMMKAGP